MVVVERTTDEDDQYFTEEEEIPWPANLYPGSLQRVSQGCWGTREHGQFQLGNKGTKNVLGNTGTM